MDLIQYLITNNRLIQKYEACILVQFNHCNICKVDVQIPINSLQPLIFSFAWEMDHNLYI